MKNPNAMDDILENSKICFIVGCHRSGTTLARLILECHPEISVYDEPQSYDYWRNRLSLIDEIKDKTLQGKSCFVFKTPNLTEQFNNPDHVARFLVRDPYHFEYEKQFLIFLVRDPRDVCLSLKKLQSTPNKAKWVDKLDDYLYHLFPQTIPAFAEKYSKELDIIKKSDEYQFSAIAALFWKIKNQSYFEYEKSGYKLLLIFFEDLVTSPRSQINKMCAFLNISFNQNMLRHHELKHIRTNKEGFTLGNTDTRRPIDPNAAELYTEKMDKEEQKIILSIAGDTFSQIQKKRI